MAEEKDPELVLIGQRFKKFRKDNKIKQENLSEVAIPVVISRIENGHRLPNPDVLRYIANKYDADINWILTGKTSKNQVNIDTELFAKVTLLEKRVRLLEKKIGQNLFK